MQTLSTCIGHSIRLVIQPKINFCALFESKRRNRQTTTKVRIVKSMVSNLVNKKRHYTCKLWTIIVQIINHRVNLLCLTTAHHVSLILCVRKFRYLVLFEHKNGNVSLFKLIRLLLSHLVKIRRLTLATTRCFVFFSQLQTRDIFLIYRLLSFCVGSKSSDDRYQIS